jgi:hypothetical protein
MTKTTPTAKLPELNYYNQNSNIIKVEMLTALLQ